jgi:hypothetical protein
MLVILPNAAAEDVEIEALRGLSTLDVTDRGL